MIAISIVIGLFLNDMEEKKWSWTKFSLARYAPASIFLWLLVPAACNEVIDPIRMLRLTAERHRQFDQETTFLKQKSSPQLCEDLLLCFYAEQPYTYDPFNATRLIQFGKLDPQPFLARLNQGRLASSNSLGTAKTILHRQTDFGNPSSRQSQNITTRS